MKKFVLFFAFLWLGFIGSSAQSNKYDLNEDGDVNVTDVILLVNYILGQNNDNGNEGNVIGEAIDLGLPNGTKWTNMNVGATSPEEYGGYYAWGIGSQACVKPHGGTCDKNGLDKRMKDLCYKNNCMTIASVYSLPLKVHSLRQRPWENPNDSNRLMDF